MSYGGYGGYVWKIVRELRLLDVRRKK